MKLLTFGEYFQQEGGEGLSYRGYQTLAKSLRRGAMAKGDYTRAADAFDPKDMDKSDDEDADDEEEDDDSEEAEKSEGVDAIDLMKSIDAYNAVESALNTGGNSRESYLQAKLDSGMLTKSERAELGRLWAHEGATPLIKAAGAVTSKIADRDPDASGLVDGSDFLKSLVSSLEDSLSEVSGEVLRDGAATRQLLKAQGGVLKGLAQVVVAQDEIIKSMADRLDHVERTPARPRAVGNYGQREMMNRALTKSVSGGGSAGDPDGERLSKSQTLRGLQQLAGRADAAGDTAALDRIVLATAKFESSGMLDANILEAVKQIGAN